MCLSNRQRRLSLLLAVVPVLLTAGCGAGQKPQARSVELSAGAVAQVKLGTAATEGEGKLRAMLGEPDEQGSYYCEANNARYTHLRWSSLEVSMSDLGKGTPVMSTWTLQRGKRTDRPRPWRLELPYGIGLGVPISDVLRRVPQAAGNYDETFGVFRVTADNDQLWWLSPDPNGHGPVTIIESGGSALLCE